MVNFLKKKEVQNRKKKLSEAINSETWKAIRRGGSNAFTKDLFSFLAAYYLHIPQFDI